MSCHKSRKKTNQEENGEKLKDRFLRFFGRSPTTPSASPGPTQPSPSTNPSSSAKSGDSHQENRTQTPSQLAPASLQHAGDTPAPEINTPVVGSPVLLSTAPEPGKHDCETPEKSARMPWSALEVALQLLEKSSDVFPPLKSAVGGLITCLDAVKMASQNDEDSDRLATELKSMVETVNQYAGELDSEDMNGSIASIASSIEKEVERIKEKQDRGKLKQVLRATQDEADIIDCYRRIEASFRQLQSNASLWTLRKMNRQHESALLQTLSPEEDARYNSAYSTTIKRRGCTAETRESIQEDVQRWIRDSKAVPIYWLNGMAGTGKTTIAYSLCEWLGTNKLLGANFFCSRSKDTCRDVNRIIPTIACQLGRYSPAFRSALCKILDGDLGTSKLNITEQFEKLMKRPLLEARSGIPDGVVIVLDALDECTEVDGVRLLVETILRLSKDLPVKFFIASRPEPTIRNKMQSSVDHSPEVLLLHDIEASIVAQDIKKYLKESLSSLSPAPSDQQIEQLAQDAGKLFIYAATVVRYVLPNNPSVDPNARLAAILSISPKSANSSRSVQKYKDLDKLYEIILTAAFSDLEEDEVAAIQVVLWTVICAKEPMTTQTLAPLLALTHPQVSFALQPLHSVLHVSEAQGLVSVLHASFSDYMLDETRSKGFHCHQATHSYLLASRCFEVMKLQLRFNIAGMESSFILHRDLPVLEGRINASISSVLFYACHYWSDHVQLAKSSDSLIQQLANFLSTQLLFWLEVLNLKQCFIGRTAIARTQDWLQNANSEVQELAADALNFVAWFYAGGQSPAPHPYGFALPFCVRFQATTYFLVDSDHEARVLTLQVGSAFGVTQDSLWEVLDSVAGGDEAILGRAKAGLPDVSSVHLVPEGKGVMNRFWEQRETGAHREPGKRILYARLIQSGLGNQLKVFFSPELMALIVPELEGGSEGRSNSREGEIGYILHGAKDSADLVVEVYRPAEMDTDCTRKRVEALGEEAQVIFHLRRPEFEKYGVVVRPRCMPARWDEIEAVLFAAARWNWHLQQINTVPTRAPVSMEMFRIEFDGTYNLEGSPSWAVADEHEDLGWAGVVDLEIGQNTMDLDMFAVRLTSRANVPLYVRMFYFDATNFSISEHYASGVGCKQGPSLPPSGTLIFGHPETSLPLAFALQPGNLTEVGFIKVFWSRESLNIDYMIQPSVFETPRLMTNDKSIVESRTSLKQEWGSVVFTIVQRSSRK